MPYSRRPGSSEGHSLPMRSTTSWKKGVSGNPLGRKPGSAGPTFAERIRTAVGHDGEKLCDMWCAVALGRLPASKDKVYLASLKSFQQDADMGDRIACSKLLAERGFGQPMQAHEHSGEIRVPVRVVHEYQASS